MRKLNLRESKKFASSQRTSNFWSQDSDLVPSHAKPTFFPPHYTIHVESKTNPFIFYLLVLHFHFWGVLRMTLSRFLYDRSSDIWSLVSHVSLALFSLDWTISTFILHLSLIEMWYLITFIFLAIPTLTVYWFIHGLLCKTWALN